MKKTGPCRHCGIETTPLWRNGPEGKPVLCNACGSRYKLCGHLNGYMPRHFHSGLRKNLQNFNDAGNSNVEDKPPSAHNLPTSGRRILSFWDNIPSRKRSRVVYEKITPMMKFRNELYKLWRVYGNPNEEEEVLLDQNLTNNFIPSNEIGLGAMILKPHDDDAPPPPKKPCNN